MGYLRTLEDLILIATVAFCIRKLCMTSGALSVTRVVVFTSLIWTSSFVFAVDADIAELKKQASEGSVKAQFRLGEMYAKGEGVDVDLAESVDWMKKAAEAGDAEAQYNLGISYLEAVLGLMDVETAIVWLKRAADQKYVAASADLGRIYSTEPSVMNEVEAMRWYRVASNLGDTQSMLLLANRYADRQEFRESFILIAKAASRGSVTAKTKLGTMYEQGIGTPVDAKKASECYLSSALNGDAFAQASIAKAYLFGDGVPIDPIQASAWMEIASKAPYLPERIQSMKYLFTIQKFQEAQREEMIKFLQRTIKVAPEVTQFYRPSDN